MLIFEEVEKCYGDFRALGPLNLELASGQVIGLLGKNGAGKSTALRLLAGESFPTRGQILWGSDSLDSKSAEYRSRIGYAPDKAPLYEDLSVEEYLSFAAEIRNMGKRSRAGIDYALASTQLKEVRHRGIFSLSHGYRQRLSIAQALVHEPELLILDEPINGLDPEQIKQVRGLLRELSSQHTIVLSSHYLPEVSECCDHLIVLSNGELRAEGKEQELLKQRSQKARLKLSFTAQGNSVSSLKEVLLSHFAEAVVLLEEHISDDKEPLISWTLEAEDTLRPNLAKWIIESNSELYELSLEGNDLENLFLDLTDPALQKKSSTVEKAWAEKQR